MIASLDRLPNDALTLIIEYLCGRRISHFDPVVKKDLQSVRLVGASVSYSTYR